MHVKPGKRLPYLLTGNQRYPKEHFQNAPIRKLKEQKTILGYLEEVEIKRVSAKENVEGNLPEKQAVHNTGKCKTNGDKSSI